MTEKQRQSFIKARREAIAADFGHLNAQQREGVLTTEGPLLLLAGAGSGKTTVLISRIANLLRYGRGSDCTETPDFAAEDDISFLQRWAAGVEREDRERALRLMSVEPVEPWRIIAITFTNKAAGELKERLERQIGPEARDVWASTFHSACVRILRRDIDKLGFAGSFTIYDTADCQSLVKRVLRDLNIDEKSFPVRSITSGISAAKDKLLTADKYAAEAERSGDIRKKRLAQVYTEYAKRMREAGALDFDDLILYTVLLLQQDEGVRAYYQRKFRYVLIDEYQDTNNLQYLLASLLAGGYKNICVVGDDDQSIYKFRGATIENILNFEQEYKGARVIRLEQNYRSTGNILSAANAVIKNNEGRKGKELWTKNGEGERIVLHEAQNEHEEGQYIAARMLEGFARGMKWKDFAVLYRINAQANQLEYAMKRNGVPYRVIGGMKFFERAEVKDVLAYLCVVNNPADNVRLLRIINRPTRGIGDKTVEAAAAIAAALGRPIYEVIRRAEEFMELQKSAAKLHLFVDMIEGLRSQLDTTPLTELYELLIGETGYLKMVQAKDEEDSTAKSENIMELKSNIVDYLKGTPEGTLSGFLDEIALYTDLEQLGDDADCAVMMTMHSAKGLEFPYVFIAGAEEGLFPGTRAIGEQDEMEEERRLCYVAMTRAKERLFVTHTRQRMLFGRTTSNKLSRFMEEIPEELVERGGEQPRYSVASDWSRDGVRRPAAPEHRAQPVKPAVAAHAAHPAQTGARPNFAKGDAVEHKAFGKGLVLSVQPMGGDLLLEVAFDKSGTKKLMAKTAAAYMKKQ